MLFRLILEHPIACLLPVVGADRAATLPMVVGESTLTL